MCRLGRACVAWLAALAACGPIRYVGDVTRRASDAVEAARAAQAEKYAPYWWTRATQYLHKAREVAAHADFQGATRFGKLATDAANQAAADARVAASDPSRRAGGGEPPPPSPPPSRPTDAPVAPSRDLPAAPAPAKDRPVPAKERPVPAKEPSESRPPPRVAPAKEPP
jgi:hypothetical protein